MVAAVIAALVREQSPDHAPHTQSFLKLHEDGKVDVKCSCSVGLTLVVPNSPVKLDSSKAPKKVEVDHGD